MIFDKFKNKTPYIYCSWEHEGWGNAIRIYEWEKGEIGGHLQRKPEIGDRIIFKMKSGKLAETKVIKVRYCGDPHDMWFATIEEVDYIAEDELDKRLDLQRKNEPKIRFLT